MVIVNSSSGLIEAVAKGENVQSGSRENPIVKKTEGLIMPGLIYAHIHFTGTRKYDLLEWVELHPVVSALRCVRDMQNLFNAGFTNVRDLGSKADVFLLRSVD